MEGRGLPTPRTTSTLSNMAGRHMLVTPTHHTKTLRQVLMSQALIWTALFGKTWRWSAVMVLIASGAGAQVPAPASHFGFEIGADRKLADWKQLTAYYEKLAKTS